MASLEPSAPSHVVSFPFMSQGHTLPLLDISKALSRLNVKVTIITTPENASSILPHIVKNLNAHMIKIPFPSINGLPKGCENTAQLTSPDFLVPFVNATKQLEEPFCLVLKEMIENKSRPICVISDFFLGWTLQTCREFDIPRIVFHGMGALSMAICKSVWNHKLHQATESDHEPICLPETQLKFTLTKSDLPEIYRFLDDDSPFPKFTAKSGETDIQSWGVLLNSFDKLEGCQLTFFEQFYKAGANAWCIGPSLLYNFEIKDFHNSAQSSANCFYWLDNHVNNNPASVIYISFGTQAHLSDENLDEIAFGLEMSGNNFLWAIKSETWSTPKGLQERIQRRGLIVRDWVEQRQILAHRAVGGFLTHCGWNSVLESISKGVPILALPMNAEQPLNAKFVVDELNAGLRVSMSGPSGWAKLSIQRQAINDGVREIMSSGKGREVRERARELGKEAMQAVKKGGSSYQSMTELIRVLCDREKGVAI